MNASETPTHEGASIRWPRLLYVDQNRRASQWRSILDELRGGNFTGCEFSLEQSQSKCLFEQWKHLIQPMVHSPDAAHAIEFRLTSGDSRKTADELNEAFPHIRVQGLLFLNLVTPPLNRSSSAEWGINRYQELLNFAHAVLRGVRFEAEASGIAIGLVAGANDCFLSPVEVRELIDAIGSWSVGACLDETLLQRGPSFEDWIATLGARAKTLRLKNATYLQMVQAKEIERLLEEVLFEGAIVIRET